MGRIGWDFHLPKALEHGGFDMVAVVDPMPERLNEAKTTYNLTGYKDCDSLLSNENLDLVIVASPTQFHAEQSIQAFEHGVDVFCDKPMAFSLEEAETVVTAMKSHGR
jgi:predicted dehydrogenase